MVYVGDLNVNSGDGLKKAIDRLSIRASSNSVWTMGQGTTTGQVTFVEKVNTANASYTEQNTGSNGKLNEGTFDLSREAGIKASLGLVVGAKAATTGKDGAPLQLQIGDTSDSFNQLKVEVGDMHTPPTTSASWRRTSRTPSPPSATRTLPRR